MNIDDFFSQQVWVEAAAVVSEQSSKATDLKDVARRQLNNETVARVQTACVQKLELLSVASGPWINCSITMLSLIHI